MRFQQILVKWLSVHASISAEWIHYLKRVFQFNYQCINCCKQNELLKEILQNIWSYEVWYIPYREILGALYILRPQNGLIKFWFNKVFTMQSLIGFFCFVHFLQQICLGFVFRIISNNILKLAGNPCKIHYLFFNKWL